MGDTLKKRRKRRLEREQAKKRQRNDGPPPKRVNAPVGRSERPTDQRAKHGHWHKGDVWTDLAADMVGKLHVSKQITDAQEQAARTWQAARAAYMQELPEVRGFKSCLTDSVPGFDDGDGDPQVIEEYRRLERIMGIAGRREVLRVCEENQRPGDMDALEAALDAIASA